MHEVVLWVLLAWIVGLLVLALVGIGVAWAGWPELDDPDAPPSSRLSTKEDTDG